MNYLSIDTEYSSFYSGDRLKSGELLQIAIVPVVDGVRHSPFVSYLRPLTKKWNKHAEKVHGISRKKAEAAPHPSLVAEELKKWISQFDCIFTAIGHNCKGDKDYISRLIADYGLINEWNSRVKTVWKDTKDIASKKKSIITVKNYQLGTLAKFFNVEIDAHDALSDAEATLKIFEMMTGMLSAAGGDSLSNTKLTNIERRKKYIDMKYVTIGSDGCVFITEFGTGNKEALQTIMEELWTIFVDDAI